MSEPEISITIKLSGVDQATEFLQKLATMMKPQAPATFTTTTSNNLMIVVPEAKKRKKYQRSVQKVNPYELVKKGYVVRGPYPKSDGSNPELVLTNPAKMWKEKVSYSVGDTGQLNQHDVLKLKAMAEPNEKNIQDGRKTRHQKPPAQKAPESKACSICLSKDVPLGTCLTLKKDPHCSHCCTNLKHRVE